MSTAVKEWREELLEEGKKVGEEVGFAKGKNVGQIDGEAKLGNLITELALSSHSFRGGMKALFLWLCCLDSPFGESFLQLHQTFVCGTI